MDNQDDTQQIISNGLEFLEDGHKNLAYEGLTAFNTADYDTAQLKFSEIINSNAEFTSSHLNLSVLLSECFLAMLQPHQSLEVLEICWNRQSPVSVTFRHPLWSQISKLFDIAQDMCQSISKIKDNQNHENWTDVLKEIHEVQRKRSQNFRLASVALPAIWLYWKTEAHLQLGDLTAAEGEMGTALNVSNNPHMPAVANQDHLWISGLMAYVKQDLEQAFEKLNLALLMNDSNVKIRKLFDIIKARREASLQEMNHYQLLKIHPEATDADIRAAFYKQALITHPDKRIDNSHSEMVQLTEARDILLDRNKRRQYDIQHKIK